MLMLEWCYQWDNSEYVEKHYEWEKKENLWNGQISKALVSNLWKERPVIWVVDNNSQNYNHKNEDPKDALYFVDL
jgi:hypothetical protein